MGFPIPGDAIEQRLDLNQYLIKRSAATFLMRVDSAMATHDDVQSGDLLVVELTSQRLRYRSLTGQPGTLVVAVQDGELMVTRLSTEDSRPIDLWGVVTSLIRQFS
ncbi:LexA family protein [Adonisia turfae]|uniref:DNA repair protein n=1 Tax=Adonisia turfae CCMR0081 TaxID=2292702 RepID=A0A6M0RJI8_9CYAN|nr:S24 family peptidase [Adonisia turfae]NEZ55821.1 DNA repair protein [Adonisia turfae CCMR0081]